MTGAPAFRVATGIAAAICVAQTITAVAALNTYGHSTRRFGFGFTRVQSVSTVTSVAPGVPLQAGDVIIAVNQADRVWLEIRDNGRGFEPHGPRNAAYGVTGMHERARQINATLEVDSAPGRGTVIRVTAPVPA